MRAQRECAGNSFCQPSHAAMGTSPQPLTPPVHKTWRMAEIQLAPFPERPTQCGSTPLATHGQGARHARLNGMRHGSQWNAMRKPVRFDMEVNEIRCGSQRIADRHPGDCICRVNCKCRRGGSCLDRMSRLWRGGAHVMSTRGHCAVSGVRQAGVASLFRSEE